MGNFFKRNWMWLLAPFVLVAILVLVVTISMSDDDEIDDARFIYNEL